MATDFKFDGSWEEMVRILRALRIRLNGLRESYIHSDNLAGRVDEYIEDARITLEAGTQLALRNCDAALEEADHIERPPVDPAQERIPGMECYFDGSEGAHEERG